MTAKRLFVGRKTCEDRFTIITDYDGEIGVKENRSGDVLVLKHSDLNAQQFVAQLVVFLNDQNQAIVDLFDGSKYWSDKATEKIKELEKENEQLKSRVDYLERKIQRERNSTQKQYAKWEKEAETKIKELSEENKQLKQQLQREHQQLENAILLERTRMGKNCLKQFREAIQ